MSDGSLTNIKVAKPLGPRIFLGALALAIVGGGAWWLTRPKGPVGEPEDPGKLLVVGKDPDVAATLKELGIQAQHGEFDALVAEGKAQGARGDGIEAIVHLADVRGIGYVAIEEPAKAGFEGLTVTGDSHEVTAEHAWAVLSVGNLGMPPKVTVDAEPSELPLPPYIELMRAAFAQNRLANTLFADNQLPMDAVEVHRQILAAVELHGAYAVLDKRVSKNARKRGEVLEGAELAERKPAILTAPLETSEVLALADGTVLSFVHGWRLESPRDVEVTLQPATEVELWFHPPGTADPKTRQRCTSLRSGTLALGSAEIVTSPRGDALLLGSESGLELWTVDAKAGACALARKGAVSRPLDFEYGVWGIPHAAGKVLRPAIAPDGVAMDVWALGADRPENVPLPGCTQIGDPVWLDEGHFAVSCAFEPQAPVEEEPEYDELGEEVLPPEPVAPPPPPPPAQTWIYLVRIADAHTVAIPGTLLGEHTGIYELHAVPGSTGLDLLAEHPWNGKVVRLRSSKGHVELLTEAAVTLATMADLDAKAAADAAKAMEEQLAAAAKGLPPPAPPTPPADAPPAPLLRPAFVPTGRTVAAVAPEGFTLATLEVGGDLDDLALSPDGTRIVFTTDRGHEVRVMTLDGASTTIAKNPEATHRRPRFTADGKAVAFTSELMGNDMTEQVGRLAVLGQ